MVYGSVVYGGVGVLEAPPTPPTPPITEQGLCIFITPQIQDRPTFLPETPRRPWSGCTGTTQTGGAA